ncbi:DUF4157 domain-containing protein [Saccharopolyspora sp. NPDC050642]|uniref:eCIS core domain-containing protein n=1 Tax=Saccharopolyspora sp. NPDC050642 TaxID=3157099 RepID=UPI0033FE8CB2
MHDRHNNEAESSERERRTRAPEPGARSGAPGSAEHILHLQRTLGNAVVARAIADARAGDVEEVQRSAVHDVLRSSGEPLDEPVRTDMESRLGADFSDVRLHTGPAAQRSAAEIGARAYTSGNHVVIGEGGTDEHTLAHELTHVIQQRSGPVAGTDNGNGLKMSDPSDRFEREAEANARRVMGRSEVAQERAEPEVAMGGNDAGVSSVQRAETRSQTDPPAPFVIRPLRSARTGGDFARLLLQKYLDVRKGERWGKNFAVLEYKKEGKEDLHYEAAFNEGDNGDHSEEIITSLVSRYSELVPVRIFTDRSPCDGCQRKLNTFFQSRTRGQDRVPIYFAVDNDCGVGKKQQEIKNWWTGD